MPWNYRILAHKNDGELYFKIHEVFYNKKMEATCYSECPAHIMSEDLKGISWVLLKMKECVKKPILWAGDKFPEIYKPK